MDKWPKAATRARVKSEEIQMQSKGSSEGRIFNFRPRAKKSNPDYEELGSEELGSSEGPEAGDEDDDVTEGTEDRKRSVSAGPATRSAGGLAGVEGAQVQKKKVGRPIAFTGDVNAPHLTEAERRRLRRREANRESARRVRMKRQAVLEDVQERVNVLQSQNHRLRAHLKEVDGHKQTLVHQMSLLRDKWAAAAAENYKLQSELSALRRTLEVQHTHLQLLQLGTPASGRESRGNGREVHVPMMPMARQPSFGLNFFRSSSLELPTAPNCRSGGGLGTGLGSHYNRNSLHTPGMWDGVPDHIHSPSNYLAGPSSYPGLEHRAGSGLFESTRGGNPSGAMPSAFAHPLAQQGAGMSERNGSSYAWANGAPERAPSGTGRAVGERQDTLACLAEAADAMATPPPSRTHSPV